jgi:hypothetical protein
MARLANRDEEVHRPTEAGAQGLSHTVKAVGPHSVEQALQ